MLLMLYMETIYIFNANRGVSGFLQVGGQVVIQVVMRHGFAAGGTFFSAKKWGGNCLPCPPFTDAPEHEILY